MRSLIAATVADFTVNPDNWLELSLRLALAVLFGGMLGWNRQTSGKAAGLRTHMLVSLGAALFIMVPLTTSNSPEAVSRAIQGVATGIGFLGAGEIVHRSREPGKTIAKGLTSAASIWVTAALGILAACGVWQVGLVGTLLAFIILVVAKPLERTPILERTNDDSSDS
jgi:putative Mg2+ transporter-C (MgtC) family protein